MQGTLSYQTNIQPISCILGSEFHSQFNLIVLSHFLIPFLNKTRIQFSYQLNKFIQTHSQLNTSRFLESNSLFLTISKWIPIRFRLT